MCHPHSCINTTDLVPISAALPEAANLPYQQVLFISVENLSLGQIQKRETCGRTTSWSVLNVDCLRLILAVVVLQTHQVGVGRCAETCAESHDVVIAVVQHLHQLTITGTTSL